MTAWPRSVSLFCQKQLDIATTGIYHAEGAAPRPIDLVNLKTVRAEDTVCLRPEVLKLSALSLRIFNSSEVIWLAHINSKRHN